MADEHHSLQTYVSDMLALERHVRIPFTTQLDDADFGKYTGAKTLLTHLVAFSLQHIDALEAALARLGGQEASGVKVAVTQIEGFFAGAIDKLRKTKVSKALRDDYTALALCTISYTMLQTTATALGDETTALLAQDHLRDYARCIIEIGQSLPQIVLEELRDLGLAVDASMADSARHAAEEAWRTGTRLGRTETGSVEYTAGDMGRSADIGSTGVDT